MTWLLDFPHRESPAEAREVPTFCLQIEFLRHVISPSSLAMHHTNLLPLPERSILLVTALLVALNASGAWSSTLTPRPTEVRTVDVPANYILPKAPFVSL
jgi:hypothetical protein